MSNILDKLTVILTTNNQRNDFIFRCLDYYNTQFGKYNLKIILSDSGTNKDYHILKEKVLKKNYKLKIEFINFISSQNYQNLKQDEYGKIKFEFTNRIKKALDIVKTDYIVLAADDDFYFPEYFYKALEFLEQNEDYGSAYGHILKFRLKKFEAYNKFIKAWISEDNNPPNPWQEDENYKDRLIKLGQYPWSWFSWYTVQRKKVMKLTIDEAINFQVDGYLFEKLVSFCHSVLYKSKKFNFVHAARQENDIHADYVREPFSYKKNVIQFNKFIDCCNSFILKFTNIDRSESKDFVLSIVAKDLNEYKKNDDKEFLRKIKKKFIILFYLQKKFFKKKINFSIDKRLANKIDPTSYIDKIDDVKKIVEKNI